MNTMMFYLIITIGQTGSFESDNKVGVSVTPMQDKVNCLYMKGVVEQQFKRHKRLDMDDIIIECNPASFMYQENQ